jgi:hypothetical protein
LIRKVPSVIEPTISTRIRGVSLAEFVFALGLAVVVVLTLVGLSLVALKGNQKSSDVLVAQSLAHQRLEREIYQAQSDSAAALWSGASLTTPFSTQQLQLGNQPYTLALYSQSLSHAGTPGLFECRLRVSWSAGTKAGYGHTHTEVRRVVSRP